jgi:DNA-binding Lrp family transcriptional regulator
MHEKGVDALDIELLKQLLEDGRQTSKDLALKLKVHKDTVRKRISSLVSRGVVESFTITINQAKLAELYPSIWHVIFSVAVLRDRDSLVKELLDHPSVVEVDIASPAAIHDIIVHTQFANSDEFDEFAHYLKSKSNIDPTKLDVTPIHKQHRRRIRIITAITQAGLK